MRVTSTPKYGTLICLTGNDQGYSIEETYEEVLKKIEEANK